MQRFWLFESLAFFKYYKFRLTLSIVGLTLGFLSLAVLLNLQYSVEQHLKELFSSFNQTRFVAQVVLNQKEANQHATQIKQLGWPNHHGDQLFLYRYTSMVQPFSWRHLTSSVNVVFIPSELMPRLSLEVAAGRGLHRLDQNQKVMIIGQELAKTMTKHGYHPVGEMVQLGQSAFEVIGTLAPGRNDPLLDFQLDNSLFLDISLSELYLSYSDLNYYVISDKSLEQAKQEVRKLFESRLNTKQIYFRDLKLFVQVIFSQIEFTQQVLSIVAALNLALGFIALVNILGLLVDERSKEIGIKICIGASKRHIILSFFREAIVLSSLSGTIGLVLASPAAYVLINRLEISYNMNWLDILVLIPIAITLGLAAGILPVWRILNKHPVDLLKS